MTHARALLVVILLLAASGCGARSELVSGDSETSFTCPDGSTAGAVSCGTITFADPVSYLVEAGGNHVVMADLNGDGSLDLAVTGWSAEAVTVLFNQGDGTFAEGVLYATSSEGGSSDLAAGDLNGDGAIDLVVTPAIDDGTSVSVLHNDGVGAFAPALLYTAGLGPTAVALADLDGNGSLDIATANVSGDNVSVLANLGDGTFGPPVTFGPVDGPHSITTADPDLKGSLDLVVTSAVASGITIFQNLGAGLFTGPVSYPGVGRHMVAAGDVNGDNRPDLAAAAVDGIDVLLNAGDGTFGVAASYPVPVNTLSLAIADLNGDCRPDLAAASQEGTASLLPNLGNGTFGPADNHVIEDQLALSIAAGDLDGDGKPDLAITYVGTAVTVLLNRGCAP